jgi:hypothetical protein
LPFFLCSLHVVVSNKHDSYISPLSCSSISSNQPRHTGFSCIVFPIPNLKKKLTHITCCKAAKNTPSKALKNVVHHYNTHISTAAILAPKIVQRHLTKELGGAD